MFKKLKELIRKDKILNEKITNMVNETKEGTMELFKSTKKLEYQNGILAEIHQDLDENYYGVESYDAEKNDDKKLEMMRKDIETLTRIQDKLYECGISKKPPQFRNFEEFDKFMQGDEPLRL